MRRRELESVKNKVINLDADRLAWAYANLERSQEVCQKGIMTALRTLLALSGVNRIYAHVSLGNKGGREVVATVKPYQGNRKDSITPEKRELITILREFIAGIDIEGIQGVKWEHQEADDGLTQMQALWNNISIMCSDDKDLRIAAGWHWNHRTNVFWENDSFGWLEVKETNKTKKLWGCGTKWFWAQMLMGDTCDNIPGLEMLAVNTCNKYFPIKKPAGRKPKKCGEMTAFEILTGAEDDRECYKRVFECYLEFYGKTAKERFFEQAFLLWMRRNETVWDVLSFLKPLGFNYIVPDVVVEALKPWTDR